ncbi:choice-of-anchor L domain-containing protein [Cellulomonas sp. URHB0016]
MGVRIVATAVLCHALVAAGLVTAPAAIAAPTSAALITAVDAPAGTVTGVTLDADPAAVAVGSSPVVDFPTRAGTYLVLSTGDATAVAPGTADTFVSTDLPGAPAGADGNDLTQVRLRLAPPARATCVLFDFTFLSEEYPEFVGTEFNDIFTAELNDSQFTLGENEVVAPLNFAYDSSGNPVSINTVFGMSPTPGTTMDGATPALTAKSPLQRGTDGGYQLILSVQDLGDPDLDSAVIIDHLRFGSGTSCKEGVTEITDTAARLGFVDQSDELRQLSRSSAGTGDTGLADALPGALAAAGTGSGTLDGSAAAARPTAIVDPTPPRDSNMPAVFTEDAETSDSPFRRGHGHDGEATGGTTSTQGTSATTVTWVSTAAREDPDAPTGAEDPGEVYFQPELSGSGGPDARITCDPAQETHPSMSPDGKRIAYASNAHGTWDIVVANAAPAGVDSCRQADPQWVTNGEGDSSWPTWLDADTVVFSSTRDDPLGDLYRIDIDGSDLLRLTTDVGVADTEPDARVVGEDDGWVIAFTTTRWEPDGSLALLVLDGAALPDPVEDPYAGFPELRVQADEPSWSPDGSPWALAFTSTRDDPAGGIWVAAWTNDGELFFDGQRSQVDVYGRAESHATWTFYDRFPSGTFANLVYTSEVATTDVSDALAADGSAVREIYRNQPVDEDHVSRRRDISEAGIDYSPDGRFVAYSVRSDGGGGPGWRLAVARADTLEAVDFPYDRSSRDIDLNPTWSPDGSTVAFVRRQAIGTAGYDPPRIFTVPVAEPGNGGSRRTSTITSHDRPERGTPFDVDPSWFPDSRHIAFARAWGDTQTRPTERFTVWTVDTQTRDATELTYCMPSGSGPEGCRTPVLGTSVSVSPDGAEMAVASLELSVPPDDPARVDARGGIGVLELTTSAVGIDVAGARTLTGLDATRSATPSRTLIARSDQPQWSPDGTEIAFSGVPAGQPQVRGIWAVSADGTAVRRVVDRPGPQHQPAYRPFTDLVLTMASGPVSSSGATVTATATNAGPALVTDGSVTVQLPDGVSTLGATGCTVSGTLVTCQLPDSFAAGQAAQFSIPVEGVRDGVTTTVAGVVASSTPERVVANNAAQVELHGTGGVAVTVALSSPDVWAGGHGLTATFTVRNVGTQPVQDVRLTTTFPAPLVVLPTGQPCLDGAGTCALGALAGGAATVLTATLNPPPVPSLPSPAPTPPVTVAVTGSVTTTSPDESAADDTAAQEVTVRRPRVVVTPAVARPGDTVFVIGTDFPPGQDVDLRWSQGVMSVHNPLVARPDGRFTQSVVLIADSLLAERRLRASSRPASPLYGEVSARLLVVQTSIDAPTFLYRK